MNVRIFRLRAVCPSCACGPWIRSAPWAGRLFQRLDPDTVVLTYQCHVRRCGSIYEIRARDFQVSG